MSLFEHGVKNLHTLVKDGEVKVSELVQESFDRIDRVDEKIGAFLSLNEEAFEQAKRMDELAKHEANPLFGLPIGVKDNIVTKGMTTTCGSKFLENFVPAHDATVVERLHEAGAVTIGKLNMDDGFYISFIDSHSKSVCCYNYLNFFRSPKFHFCVFFFWS